MKRIARVFDPNLLFRIFPSAIFALAILMASRSLAQSPPPFPGGPPHVVLENPAPGTVPQFPSFSEQPTTQEIIRAKVFEEPFVPVWGDPSPDENKAFARAIIAFGNRSKRDDFSALTQFLNSPSCINWYPSLLFSLGWEYYHTGYFSKAIDAWDEAWLLTEDETDPASRRLADRIVGELAKMHARIGGFERLQELLEELGDRHLVGSASENVAGARQALWLMLNEPEISFRCGPLALRSISSIIKPSANFLQLIQQTLSTQKGVSLWQLWKLSQDLKLNFQIAKRQPGASVPVPCVAHWKVGHYGALLKRDGDRYLLVDPTFGNSLWVSQDAIDAEASSYFLIPPIQLPTGWQDISADESKAVWGRGVTAGSDPNNTTTYDLTSNPDCGSVGLATFNVHLFLVSLHIEDTPLAFTPPRGPPIAFTVTYNQREANQPANFSYSNFGQKWTCNWISYIKDNGSTITNDVDCYMEGGGTEPFKYNAGNGAYDIQWQSQASLLRTSPNSYQITLPDGSKKIFGQPDGTIGSTRKVFLTQVVDPTGYAANLNYDANLRLVTVTDPQAQVTNLTFYYNADPLAGSTYTIQEVTDRYGRSAIFAHKDFLQTLESVTDVLGLTSTVFYASGVIDRLRTPYGDTSFAFGDDGNVRWLEATDADGNRSKVEYNQSASLGVPISDPGPTVPLGMWTRNYKLYSRNTFYWDKRAMREAPGDYSKARLYHWLHSDGNEATAVGVLESYKEPLENRVWFNYPGQADSTEGATILGNQNFPTVIGRVLDDGHTQLYKFYRNSLGRITNATDPIGRNFTFVYATNEIDLMEIRQTRGTNNELLAAFTYNAQHLPLTAKDAAGQTTRFAYNSYSQLLGITNALSQVTFFNYFSNGLLWNIDGPLAGTNDSASFTYDAYDRVRTATDTDGYTVTIDYDSFDRPITNSYPDGTFESINYKYLDPETYIDRAGKVTHFFYTPLRQLKEIREATNWVTRLDWCRCGDLDSITDPLGQVTRWFYDIQGRVTAKQYADDSRIEYTYETTTSRLKSLKNERGQTRNFYYEYDDDLLGVVYANPQVTPTVVFTYDTNYNRLTSTVDGSGTNKFEYYPVTALPTLGAGRLKSVDGRLSYDTMTYNYDELGRVVGELMADPGFPGGYAYRNEVTYDAAGRIYQAKTYNLFTFTYAYSGASKRITSISYPNGQSTSFGYFDALGDFRLSAITNLDYSGNLLSKFQYAYNRAGQITNWIQQLGSQSSKTFALAYDAINQLTNAVALVNGATNQTYQFTYDLAGNRTGEQTGTNLVRAWYNPLNEIVGKDTGSSAARSYEWDEENRLVAITEGTWRTTLLYNGFGRLAYMEVRNNGALVYPSFFVWSGDKLSEQLIVDPSNQTSYFIFNYDEMHLDWLGRPFYVTRDHLGSVREVTDAQTSGGFFRRYDYDLFGRRSTLSDNLGESPSTGPNVGYAGLYTIRVHNLPYALNRVYDPDLGRWLSRDPAGEAGGVNLYRFANNDPVNYVDLDGLCPVPSQGARVTRSPVGSGGGVRPPRPPRVTSSADASEEGGSWGPQRANAATGALRHAAWAGDINAINATAVRLGQRALERSGGDWVTSEQLFERYLQGVQNRLARTGSQFAVEIQPAAIPGRGRVPGFQQVGGTTFPTRGSRRLDAGIVGPKGKLVSGFDITLDPNKPSVVQYYQEAFGNIPIFDIRLP